MDVEGTITHQEAVGLTGEFLIGCYEVGFFWLMLARDTLQGITGIWVWTLGGVNEDGTDACNDMTDCLLEAARMVRVANPTFAFRYHPGVRMQTMRQVFECIRQGLGYPAMRNDPVLITNAMHWHGHPLKEARRWVHQACMSPCPDTTFGVWVVEVDGEAVAGFMPAGGGAWRGLRSAAAGDQRGRSMW